jgi:hypothetical protein
MMASKLFRRDWDSDLSRLRFNEVLTLAENGEMDMGQLL